MYFAKPFLLFTLALSLCLIIGCQTQNTRDEKAHYSGSDNWNRIALNAGNGETLEWHNGTAGLAWEENETRTSSDSSLPHILLQERGFSENGYLKLQRYVRRAQSSWEPFYFTTAISSSKYLRGQLRTNTPEGVVFINFSTASDRIELEFYSERTQYQVVERRVVTPLSASYHFGKMNFYLLKNGDLMGLKHKDTGSGSLEVHILSSTSNYQNFSLQTATSLSEQEASYYYCQARTRDLICLRDDVDDKIQLRILDPNSNYQTTKYIVRTNLSFSAWRRGA